MNSDDRLTEMLSCYTFLRDPFFSLPEHQGREKQFFLLSPSVLMRFLFCTPQSVSLVPMFSAISHETTYFGQALNLSPVHLSE